MQIDTAALPRQFRYWALHCALNSLPSLGIAIFWLQMWRHSSAVLAMLAAIASFIILYTVATSIRGPLTEPGHLLARALRAGTKFRMVISLLSIPALFPPLMFFMPDMWCGLLASQLVSSAAQILRLQGNFNIAARGPEAPGFFQVYATTMLEGFILSFMLLMISFFAVIVIQRKERRRLYEGLPPRR